MLVHQNQQLYYMLSMGFLTCTSTILQVLIDDVHVFVKWINKDPYIKEEKICIYLYKQTVAISHLITKQPSGWKRQISWLIVKNQK